VIKGRSNIRSFLFAHNRIHLILNFLTYEPSVTNHLHLSLMKLTLLFIPILILAACAQKKEETAIGALPQTRPLDFVLETHYGGGMRDTSAGFFISADTSFFKTHSGNITVTHRVKISAIEIDTLYSILKRNKFDRIESTIDSTVLDAESYSVSIYWNKNQNSISVSDGGQRTVKEEWNANWRSINQYLDNFIPAEGKRSPEVVY
jgi:hypothetical protein